MATTARALVSNLNPEPLTNYTVNLTDPIADTPHLW
jgi:hypothetical protein